MTTKTDIQGITLTAPELAACHAKAVNASEILICAKQTATELANLIGELLKVIPAGSNKTTLTTIQSNLL
jgi:hypothetical protein